MCKIETTSEVRLPELVLAEPLEADAPEGFFHEALEDWTGWCEGGEDVEEVEAFTRESSPEWAPKGGN